jgi:hypothetical protein
VKRLSARSARIAGFRYRLAARWIALFPVASVSGFEKLIPALSLPDPDDLHVLAAALHARAELIIKGFPDSRLDPA